MKYKFHLSICLIGIAILSCQPQVDRLAVFTQQYNEQPSDGISKMQMFGKNSPIFATHSQIVPRDESTLRDIEVTFSSYLTRGNSTVDAESQQLKNSFILFIDRNQLTKDLLKRGVTFQLLLLSRNGSTLTKELIDSTSYKQMTKQEKIQ